MTDFERIQELTALLNRASESYYAKDEEIISNFEYDRLYDELVALEEKTGITLADSPTVKVGYESVEELPKERHEKPMLSLSKTKSREELRDWLGDQDGLLSWKLDGLTIVLTYRDGKLVKAVTRGNGEVGEVITNNAKTFVNVPLAIPHRQEVILRGEAIITYSEFERINAEIENPEEQYKNPRNLCSGSVRQLNNEITAKRRVQFHAFNLVKAEGFDARNSKENEYKFLREQGFSVVEYERVNRDTIEASIEGYARRIVDNDIPSDGLVLLYDDIEYGKSLGRTAKFPRDSIAFKWADETATTTLREVEWSASRTGLINPVAIFDPVELEGTTVTRASLHNLTYIRELKLGIGDTITVYKANMIIPQIAENLTNKDGLPVPGACPVCGGKTVIRKLNESESLLCENPDCPAKKIKSFELCVSRDALNIEGLSEMTLEKFLGQGFLKEVADLYHLDRYRTEITAMEGFGEKSYENLIAAVEASRESEPHRVLYSLGIAGVGLQNAKLIMKHFGGDFDALRKADVVTLTEIDKIGEVIARDIVAFFADEKQVASLDALLAEVHFKQEENTLAQTLEGVTVVITGSLNTFARREDLVEEIERRGGHAAGSVSAKTGVLVNNDINSTSGKNKKAKELNVPIMTEADFIAAYFV